MARRGDETQAEPLEIVEGVVERVDLELAAIAGAGIDLADGESCGRAAPWRRDRRLPASSASAVSSGAGAASVTGRRIRFLNSKHCACAVS